MFPAPTQIPGQGDAEKSEVMPLPNFLNTKNVEVLRGAPTHLQASPRPWGGSRSCEHPSPIFSVSNSNDKMRRWARSHEK